MRRVASKKSPKVEVAMNVKPVMRKAPVLVGTDSMPNDDVMLMSVLPMPAPWSVTFFVMSTFDHDQEPAGHTMVSPDAADAMAATTAVCEHVAKLFVAALAFTLHSKMEHRRYFLIILMTLQTLSGPCRSRSPRLS